jgi:S-adenosylmethionine hydrolase
MAKRKSSEGSTALSNSIDGNVASCDSAGNLVTDIPNDSVAGLVGDEGVSVKFDAHETFGIFPAAHGEPDATMVASLGDSGFVQIEIVGISLSEMLGIREGAKVRVAW